MKIRQGFVSNSSSTSFVIYGIIPEIDFSNQEDVIEMLENVKKLAEEKISTIKNNNNKREEWKIEHLNGTIKNINYIIEEMKKGNTKYTKNIEDIIYFDALSEILGLEYYTNPFSDTNYIGRSLTKIKEDQTRREFEEETKQIIRKAFPDIPDNEFGIIADAWEDR